MEINKHKGEVRVVLGGKEYKARLTVNSIIAIEDAVDMGIIKLAQKMSEGDVRLSHVISVLTPALRGGGNDLQANDVVELVQRTGLVNSIKAVAELLTVSLSDNSEERTQKRESKTRGINK